MFLSQPFGFLTSGGGIVVPLLGGEASADVPGNDTATAGWRFNSNGSIDMRNTSGWVLNQQFWYSPVDALAGASHWIRATLVSGSTPSGTLNTWQALSTARSWTLSVTGGGAASCNLLIEIATSASDADIVTDGSFLIDVLSEP